MRLADRVIMVTGAGGGIGPAYVRRLIEEGAFVVASDLQAGPAEGPALDSSRCVFVRADVRRPDDVQRLVETARSRFGRIDGLINNAALWATLRRQPFEELTIEEWQQVLSVNVIGAFSCIKAVVPLMKAQKSGKIINIASNVVHKGLPFLLHYVASKGALVAMTRSLARELGPHGIQVNAVAPGYVLHEGTAATDAGRNEVVVKLRCLCRTQTPEDLCGTVVFLCSPDSDFVTGQTIVVDGGEVFA